MNNTLKSILIIGGTFIIGLILGGLIVGKVIHPHGGGGPEKHIKRLFMGGLDLTDAQQKDMKAVLLKYKPKQEQLIESFEKQKNELLDEMTSEMEPFLETAQMTKLQRRIERMKKYSPFHRHKRKGRKGRENEGTKAR